jgi:hypothetical protein
MRNQQAADQDIGIDNVCIEALRRRHLQQRADSVVVSLRRQTPHYGVDFSQTTQNFYWMNHCEHCAAKLGDFDTHGTPGVGFMPRTSDEAAGICLEEIAKPFSAWCGRYTCGLEWFADAQHQISSQHPDASHDV